jgi:hypothetical protein
VPYVRVVRFTDVTPDRVESLVTRIKESGGPPEGVSSNGIQMLFDEGQGSAVVLQMFETSDDMESSERVFEAMDASETPGTRASVDKCEVKVDVRA